MIKLPQIEAGASVYESRPGTHLRILSFFSLSGVPPEFSHRAGFADKLQWDVGAPASEVAVIQCADGIELGAGLFQHGHGPYRLGCCMANGVVGVAIADVVKRHGQGIFNGLLLCNGARTARSGLDGHGVGLLSEL